MTKQRLIVLFSIILLGLGTTPGQSESHYSVENIESELSAYEAHFADLIDGAEKQVRWYDEKQGVTPISLVYLHGFSASRQELSPLIENLADELQANVFYSRLAGHGRSDDAMIEGSVKKWQADTLEAFTIGRLIGHKVIVIGTSTGGTLATWLAAQPNTESLHSTILISPNFGVKSRGAAMLQNPVGLWLVKLISGEYRSFTPNNAFHAKYWTERYPIDAVVPMLDLVDQVANLDKSTISCPLLIIYSPHDKVIDVNAIEQITKELVTTNVTEVPFTLSKDPSQHVLVGKASSPNEVEPMLNLIMGFIEQLAD